MVSNRQFGIHINIYLRVCCCGSLAFLLPPCSFTHTPICHSLLRIYRVDTHIHTAHICYWICCGVACCYYWLHLAETLLLPGYLFVHARSVSRIKKTWHSHTHVHVYGACVCVCRFAFRWLFWRMIKKKCAKKIYLESNIGKNKLHTKRTNDWQRLTK